MLLELNVKNFILIDDMSIQFSKGLNILTGETGAGKSIILEGLRIVLGKRTSKDYLKNQDEKATFEMIFSLDNDLLAITREIFPSGKAISRLNGEITNVQTIEEEVLPYLDIYGQKDHFLLLDTNYQMNLIDSLIVDQSIFHQLEENYKEYSRLNELLREAIELSGASIEREEGILHELQSLQIDVAKDTELEENFDIFSRQQEIKEELSNAINAMDSSLESIYDAQRSFDSLSRISDTFSNLEQRLQSTQIESKDILETLKQEFYRFDLDETELEAMNERITVLFEMKKKYQRDLPGLKQYAQELSEKVERFYHLEKEKNTLEKKLEETKHLSLQITDALRQIRKKSFLVITEQIQEMLKEIGLKDASFDLQFTRIDEERVYPRGNDKFEIIASMNRTNLAPLKEVLSGGEMSRFILALKAVLANREETRTMVFDEIDTGISGRTAFEVGKLIKRLSQGKQVIAITHLPQLTSFADTHSIIEKIDGGTKVHRLNLEEHVTRIAEMMSSKVSSVSISNAKELVERARKESL